MKNIQLLSFFFMLLIPFTSVASDTKPEKVDKRVAVTGRILDFKSTEALAGARLYIHELDREVFADFDGEFTIEGIEPGTYTLSVSFLSYNEITVSNLKIENGKILNPIYLHSF